MWGPPVYYVLTWYIPKYYFPSLFSAYSNISSFFEAQLPKDKKFKYFIDIKGNGATEYVVHKAIFYQNDTVLKYIMTGKSKRLIEPEGYNENYPLHLAVFMNNLDAVKIIMESNATKDKKPFNSNGQSPLHLAAFYGQTDVMEYLIGIFGPNFLDGKGRTPLHSVAMGCYSGIRSDVLQSSIDTLLEFGANPAIVSNDKYRQPPPTIFMKTYDKHSWESSDCFLNCDETLETCSLGQAPNYLFEY